MRKRVLITVAIVVLVLTSCVTLSDESQYADSAFSFSQCELPSLMDINVLRKWRVALGDHLYRLTNVHPSFDKSFVLLRDESRQVHIIRSKSGQTVFEGDLDGVPRYAACVDIDRDGDPDALVELAAYGTRGTGAESFEVLLNEKGRLTKLKNPFQIQSNAGQENKAGVLTWYSAPTFCAVFVGEEASVTGGGTEVDPIMVGEIRRVKEVWGRKNGEMRLISKSSVPISRQGVKYMTFR